MRKNGALQVLNKLLAFSIFKIKEFSKHKWVGQLQQTYTGIARNFNGSSNNKIHRKSQAYFSWATQQPLYSFYVKAKSRVGRYGATFSPHP